MADPIAMMSGIGTGIDGMLYQVDDTASEFLGLKEGYVSNIIGEVAEYIQKIAEEMQQI